jgi:hypothetical protein
VSLRNNAKKDTYRHKKESFPDPGEERNRFCVKGKKICVKCPPLHCFKLTKESSFHICIALSCFFPTEFETLQKRGLKNHSLDNWSNSIEVPSKSPPPPTPLVHRLLRERWNMIIELSFQKSSEKNASIVKNLTWFF